MSMRLLLFTKRVLTAKDIVLEKFGRYYELATKLADREWDVRAYCLDYRSGWSRERRLSGSVDWYTYSFPAFAFHWNASVKAEIRRWKPDVILAGSDPIHIHAGYVASRLLPAPLALDLHDNLESFRLARFPGMVRSLRLAVKAADSVSCVSEPLRAKVIQDYGRGGDTWVLENAVPESFRTLPHDRMVDRQRYGFSEQERVVGLAGALYKKRGIQTVLEGFDRVRAHEPNLVLALAGPKDDSWGERDLEGVRYFGNLPYESMPGFMRTFDVGIVPNIRPAFADYCHPQKSVELCALSLPIVAADLGVMKITAAGSPDILYQPQDPDDLARALRYQLAHRIILDHHVHTWVQQADTLHESLLRLLEQ